MDGTTAALGGPRKGAFRAYRREQIAGSTLLRGSRQHGRCQSSGRVHLARLCRGPQQHQTSHRAGRGEGTRARVRRTYPDLFLTVEQQIAEGEWVVTRVTARGTHEGVWLGMRPTGQNLEMTAVNIDRVVDGRIVEHGGAANLLEPFLEIGAIRIADPVDG